MAKEPKLQKLTKIAGTKFVQLYKGIFELPNGYKTIGRHHKFNDIVDLCNRNMTLINQYDVCIVASDEGILYLSEADYRQALGYDVINLNFKNLMKVE